MEPREPTGPEEESIAQVFLLAAAEAAITPIVINRFQVMNTGISGQKILVLGGAGAAQMRKRVGDELLEQKVLAKVQGAFALTKELAADLALFLEHEFEIADDFKAERIKRYPVLQETGSDDA